MSSSSDSHGLIQWHGTTIIGVKAGGKTVIIASTRGGEYSTSEGGRAMEHQESYLAVVFGFFGVTDIRFVRAEGLAMGDDAPVTMTFGTEGPYLATEPATVWDQSQEIREDEPTLAQSADYRRRRLRIVAAR